MHKMPNRQIQLPSDILALSHAMVPLTCTDTVRPNKHELHSLEHKHSIHYNKPLTGKLEPVIPEVGR